MRTSVLTLIGCLSLCAPAPAQSPLEQQVLAALNAARADPQGLARAFGTFRSYFHANLYALPGSAERIETVEGVAAVDEAIGYLNARAPLPPILPAEMLDAAAADHVAEQSVDGATGHRGTDGSMPWDRMRRHGGGAMVAEVIEYGAVDAIDAVRQLVIDDGVPDRGHRSILFDPKLRYAGVSCGPHPEFRTMCVIDLGMAPDGRELPTLRWASADPAEPRTP